MTAAELREKIRMIIPTVVGNRKQAAEAAVEYASIDWVAPRPTTFRINLKNDFNFYLIFTKNSWIAQVEGKKYYLLNLPEEERAIDAIARVLRYGAPESADTTDTADTSGGSEDIDVEDNVDVDIEV